MEKKENPLKYYLETIKEAPFRFSKRSGIPNQTINRIVLGKNIPYLRTVKKICKYANGELTPADFGYTN